MRKALSVIAAPPTSGDERSMPVRASARERRFESGIELRVLEREAGLL